MRIFEIREFPKNRWVDEISSADKLELSDNLISLVQTAYKNTDIGSFVNKVSDVMPPDWNVIDIDDDPDIDACVFYRKPRSKESWDGIKIQGIGHDGSKYSKAHAIAKVQRMLILPGTWIEASGAIKTVLLRQGSIRVTDEKFLQYLFQSPDLTMIDDHTYRRTLSNGQVVEETVFGYPVLR